MILASTFDEFFSLDLKSLPTEALEAIRSEAHDVLRRRGEVKNKDDLLASRALRKRAGFRDHRWLDSLLEEDWSSLFSGDETPKYYVYAHVNPYVNSHKRFVKEGVLRLDFRGVPFYIGKGTGNRAYDLNRNQGHGQKLKELRNAGATPAEVVQVLADKLTEAQALELESKLIFFYGTLYERSRGGILVNLDIPPRPEHQTIKAAAKQRRDFKKQARAQRAA